MNPVGSVQQVANNDNISNETPYEAFLKTLDNELDSKIGQVVFQEIWDAMLGDIEVTGWKKEEENLYRLTLDKEPVIAAKKDGKDKTWYFETEILMEFKPDNNEIIFPKVKELKEQIKESGATYNPSLKNLHAIWAWESVNIFMVPAGTYTGVGYSMRWDIDKNMFISLNINDAPFGLGRVREKNMDEALFEWNERDRELLSDYNVRQAN